MGKLSRGAANTYSHLSGPWPGLNRYITSRRLLFPIWIFLSTYCVSGIV